MPLSTTITLKTPEATMYSSSCCGYDLCYKYIWYLVFVFVAAAAMNWWYYARAGAEKPDAQALCVPCDPPGHRADV